MGSFKIMIRLGVYVCIVLLFVSCKAIQINPDFIFNETVLAKFDDLPGYEPHSFIVADTIRLDAFYADVPNQDTVFIFLHGNTGSLYFPMYVDYYRAISDLGYDLFAYDYRGYGFSEGETTEASFDNLGKDVNAALAYLNRIRPNAVPIIYGASLGTLAAINRLQQDSLNAIPMILDGAVADISKIVKNVKSQLPTLVRVTMKVKVDDSVLKTKLEDYEKIEGPTLFLHGEGDELTPYKPLLEQLEKLPPGTARLITDSRVTHIDWPTKAPVVWRAAVKEFLRELQLKE